MLGLKLQETRVYQEAKAEGEQIGEQRGRQEGRQEEAKSLIIRQLTRRVGTLPDEVRLQIDELSIAQLESLGEALLDFTKPADLEVWLASVAE